MTFTLKPGDPVQEFDIVIRRVSPERYEVACATEDKRKLGFGVSGAGDSPSAAMRSFSAALWWREHDDLEAARRRFVKRMKDQGVPWYRRIFTAERRP